VLYLAFVKLMKNKWLFLSLSVSILLFITAANLLPMFNNALINRTLLMNYNNSTLNQSTFSNRCSYIFAMDANNEQDDKTENYYSNLIENQLINQYQQPIAYFNKIYTSQYVDIMDVTYKPNNSSDNINTLTSMKFNAINDLENHISLISGKMPAGEKDNEGNVEVIVSNDNAIINGLVIGRVYIVHRTDEQSNDKDMPIKITGIFNPVIGGSSSFTNSSQVSNLLICDYNLFKELFVKNSYFLGSVKWDYLLDYTAINPDNIENIISAYQQQSLLFANYPQIELSKAFSFNGVDTLTAFTESKQSLDIMILVFTAPMFLLLLFCIFFISKLIVEMDKNEISVLQSRGASIYNIAFMYLIQSVALVIVPLILSPFLATAICKLLGFTTGFMEVGNNIPLSTDFSLTGIIFDIGACLIVIITILIPSILAAGTNIVERKQKATTKPHIPFWKKFYFDFILLAVSVYGYINFTVRQNIIVSQNLSANQIPIEPLTFLIMVLFLISMGLIFMRFYPFIIKIISNIGRKIWSAPFYHSLQRVTILKDKEQFIMLLIILTMSLGIFSANSARTVNKNLDDYISYSIGADVVLKPFPTNYNDPNQVEIKPSLDNYSSLKGVDNATIISIANSPQIYANKMQNQDDINMIGIDVLPYSKIVWSRQDMLSEHINSYFNLLGKSPQNCIISKTLADKMSLAVGDSILVNINEMNNKAFYINIVAIVEAWPSYTYSLSDDGKQTLGDMIITNSEYLEREFIDVTYNVWLTTDNSTSASDLIQELSSNLHPNYILGNRYKDLNESQNSAQRQSLNALLTLSFLIIFAICFVGFAIYWILSIKSRALQFGTLRAMGMSKKSIYVMLLWEQLFISGITTVYAILIGGVSSRVFVDILKVSFGADKQIIPFLFVTSQTDYIKIFIFFGIMFVFTFMLIVNLIKRIKIAQIIKLGEE